MKVNFFQYFLDNIHIIFCFPSEITQIALTTGVFQTDCYVWLPKTLKFTLKQGFHIRPFIHISPAPKTALAEEAFYSFLG